MRDGRPEVMAWCAANGLNYIFGLAGNAVLDRLVRLVADDVRAPCRGRKSDRQRLLRDPLTTPGPGVVSDGSGPHRGDGAGIGYSLRCDEHRGRRCRVALRRPVLRVRLGREPDQIAQDPACVRSHELPFTARQTSAPRAAQRRLLADTQGPQCRRNLRPLGKVKFATLWMRLIKIATRIVNTASRRVRIVFAATQPEAALFASLAHRLQPAGP
jgi:hypothetical protein